MERDLISDIRPPKKQISDIRPRKNQISDITRSQKSDIWHKKNEIPNKINYQISHPPNIRYQGTPPPPIF